MKMFKRDTVFSFKPVFDVDGIKLSCSSCNVDNELFAFVVRSGDILLSKFLPGSGPIVRWIPWFDDIKRKIKAMCFSPDSKWLLIVGSDCSLYIVPCMALLESDSFKEEAIQQWSLYDISVLPSPALTQEYSPTCIAWWTRAPTEPDFREVGILGCSNGQVTVFALSTGSVIINVKIEEAVSSISVFDQRPNACVLVTNEQGKQWRLVLSEVQPTQVEVPKTSDGRSSRLQGLKQLSVDTIASIKQRITESRSKSLVALHSVECSEGETVTCAPQFQLNVLYERVAKNLYSFHRRTIAVVYPANIVVIDNFEMHTNTVHKLPFSVQFLTVTDCLFLFTNESKSKIFIASQEYSICKSDCNKQLITDSDCDSILEEFELANEEQVLNISCLNAAQVRCLITTNLAVYAVTLKDEPRRLALEQVMSIENLDVAEKIATVFRVDIEELICEAGNAHLMSGRSWEASQLYALSKGGSMKKSVMFAVLGRVPDLLSSRPSSVNASDKVHLSNLRILAYVHECLTNYTEEVHEEFQATLQQGGYDEALAVSVLAQAGLCSDLLDMTRNRGLQHVTIVALANLLQYNYPLNVSCCPGFWNLLSDESLCEALICKSKVARIHLNFIQSKLPLLKRDYLESFLTLYDPLRKPIQPWISRSCQGDVPVQLWVQTYLMIAIYLSALDKKVVPDLIARQFTEITTKPCREGSCRSNDIGAGFNHCVIILNGTVYSWGLSSFGAVGCGPTVAQITPPSLLETFPSLGIHILSVTCGRNHSLAITDCGLYAWGSNKYNQLGIEGVSLTWFPQKVSCLDDVELVSVSAGQYHSLALDTEGKVYSWGWGVHGQLGHGNIENVSFPTVIEGLKENKIVNIAGGHAHSLFLDKNGEVWACGSSAFGQLGTGSNSKSSLPIQVFGLPEPIKEVSTGYFHSVALAEGGRVYQWGCSPTVLRATAHAAKRKMRCRDAGAVSAADPPGSKVDDSMSYLTPTLVDTSHVSGNILKVSCGLEHSALITSLGNVYTWGRNMDGQLGQGSASVNANKGVTVPHPTLIGGSYSMKEVSCGADYTVAIDSVGKVWVWGAAHHSPGGRTALAALVDGEVVVFKMKSRVIKLPHLTTTSNPLPTLLPIPTQYNHYGDKPLKRIIDVPESAYERTHYVVETLGDLYQSAPLLELASSLEEASIGSKIALVNNEIVLSFEYLVKTSDSETIFSVLDRYLTMVESKLVSSLLEVILLNWLTRSLPLPPFEEYIKERFSSLGKATAHLLFRVNSDYSVLVNQFTTQFTLTLLESLLDGSESNLDCVLPGVETINDAIVAIKLSNTFIDINESNVYESVSCNSSKSIDPNCSTANSSSFNSRQPALYLK